MGTQNTNLSVEQVVKEREFFLNQLQEMLIQQESLLALSSNQSTSSEREAFSRLSAMVDRTISQIETTQQFYKSEILKVAKRMGNTIAFGL